ncbi:hypothetical protein D918_04148 [Trichuris suis]|nr:hypothetical protein D918_04148 [Trichuris suis]
MQLRTLDCVSRFVLRICFTPQRVRSHWANIVPTNGQMVTR